MKNVDYRKIESFEVARFKKDFDKAHSILDTMNDLEVAIARLRDMPDYVTIPDDMSNISPLKYIDYLDRVRYDMLQDKRMTEDELLLNLKILFCKQRQVERYCRVVRELWKEESPVFGRYNIR